MNILHITYSFGLGGIETMLLNIANCQSNLNHKVHVFVINDEINDELCKRLNPQIEFHALRRVIGSKNPFDILKINLLIAKIAPDVIHFHYASITKFVLLPNYKKISCVTLHAMCSKENSEHLYRFKNIYAISNVVKEDISKVVNLNSEVVLNGLDPTLISCKRKINNPDKFKIVQLSRLLHKVKGQHILIEAIKILKDKGHTNLQLDLIGGGESYQFLKDLVAKLGVEDIVNFLGERDQPYIFEHLCNYDLSVQPSIIEGFGLTVAEAMAAKVPVLVSENQGPLEIIDYGKFGYVFKNGDAADCAKTIDEIITKGRDNTLVELAYKRATHEYNVNTTAKEYINKYTEFISKG